ncbi:hypothetical protein SAMN05421690_1003125 [Nitrosomonas sp. Nm51]|nr:hypothetical protein SAMN05421690_1003125 [Nitrosomonas sp. Nm51]
MGFNFPALSKYFSAYEKYINQCSIHMILPGSVNLSVYMATPALQAIAVLLSKDATQTMDAGKLTHRALPWCSATALQYLKREQSFAAYCVVA